MRDLHKIIITEWNKLIKINIQIIKDNHMQYIIINKCINILNHHQLINQDKI